MNDILSTKHYGRIFLYTMAATALLLIVIRYFVLPIWDSTLATGWIGIVAKITDSLTVSIIVTVSVALFIRWLTPESLRKTQIEVVAPREIRSLLIGAAEKSKTWTYRGACGRYTRVTTLTRMAEAAKREKSRREVRISVLDPGNDKLCVAYASYRNTFADDSRNELWSSGSVRQEVVATILSALCSEFRMLDINVYLLSFISVFRVDISDEFVVVTKEDPKADALRAERGTFYYSSFFDETKLYQSQSTKVELDPGINSFARNSIDGERVKSLLEQLGILSEAQLLTINFDKVASLIKDSKDPYK